MTCICCCEDKRKYLDELANKFGKDVVDCYYYSLGDVEIYKDDKEKQQDFYNRWVLFLKQMREDTKNFCKYKNYWNNRKRQ